MLLTKIWLFLTYSVCGYNGKIRFKPGIAPVRSVKLNSPDTSSCKHIPFEAIWFSSYSTSYSSVSLEQMHPQRLEGMICFYTSYAGK